MALHRLKPFAEQQRHTMLHASAACGQGTCQWPVNGYTSQTEVLQVKTATDSCLSWSYIRTAAAACQDPHSFRFT